MSGEATAVKTEDGEDSSVPRVLREGDHSTNLTLLVEGRRLHFLKAVLTLCSPVFQGLLTPQYLQQHPEGIPLAGKHYSSVAFFLQLLHPVFSVTPITDDRLLSTLALAKEYQVKHIGTKCEQHIGSQLQLHELKEKLTTDSLLIYLTACYLHNLHTHRATLVKLASKKTTQELQENPLYDSAPSTAMRDVFLGRCMTLENQRREMVSRNRQLEQAHSSSAQDNTLSWRGFGAPLFVIPPGQYPSATVHGTNPWHQPMASAQYIAPGHHPSATAHGNNPWHQPMASARDIPPGHHPSATAHGNNPRHQPMASARDIPPGHHPSATAHSNNPRHQPMASARVIAPGHHAIPSSQNITLRPRVASSRQDITLQQQSTAPTHGINLWHQPETSRQDIMPYHHPRTSL